MTPTEMSAILDRYGVPVEARADVKYNKCPSPIYTCAFTSEIIGDDLAHDAHVGAMLRWLVSQDTQVHVCTVNTGVVVALETYDAPVHPTLFQALAAACGDVAKEAARKDKPCP